MIKPLEAWWTNFLSYGNNETRIKLDFEKPTLIVGKNLDAAIEGQVDSNGSGKSVLTNVLSYVLYDRTIGGKIKVDKLINNINKKNLLVGVSFEKSVGSSSKFYFVERWRKNRARGGDGIMIKENTTNDYDSAIDITEDSISRANKQLEAILGHSFDVFARICLYSSAHDSFFSLPITSVSGTNRSDIIEELFSITDLSKDADILKEDIKANKTELNLVTNMNIQIVEELVRHTQQLKDLEREHSEWGVASENKKVALVLKLEKLSKINFNDEKLLFDNIKEFEAQKNVLVSDKNTLKNSVSQIELAKSKSEMFIKQKELTISQLKSRLDTLKSIPFSKHISRFAEISEVESSIRDLKILISAHKKEFVAVTDIVTKLSSEIDHLKDSKCPYCSQDYAESKVKLVNKRKEHGELLTKLQELETAYSNEEIELVTFNDKIVMLKKDLVYQTVNEYITAQADFDSINSKIEDSVKMLNPHEYDESSLVDINKKMLENEKNHIKLVKKIDKYTTLLTFSTERDLNLAEAELNNIKTSIESGQNEVNPHEKMLSKLRDVKLADSQGDKIQELSDEIKHQEFLYKLLTSKDSFIRKALISKNLEYLNNRFQHYLKKIGLPHKVMLNFDMSVTISEFNNEIDYENLSTGQKARINIALSFAFRDVLQKRHGKITFTILDECLDVGLGNIGVQMTVKMIKEVVKEESISMFIISHRDETQTMFDSKMEIEKNNKFSSITYSDI